MITSLSTLEDIAFAVCTLFHSHGKTIVLTGGSAATVYAPEQYQSRDLDFVMQFSSAGSALIAELASLGYQSGPGSMYKHPNTHFTIDFLDENLAIGETSISTWATLKRDQEILHVLTPEDCICDRLASYIYWNDLSALKAAAAVLKKTNADMSKIEKWLRAENADVEKTINRLQTLSSEI